MVLYIHSHIKICVISGKFDRTFLFRSLQTPGERTGERMVTSASLAGTMSVRLRHLLSACGAGSRWRTCTTITTITADTSRDTTDDETPPRPLFFSWLSLRTSAHPLTHKAGWDRQRIDPRAPEPTLFFYTLLYSGDQNKPSSHPSPHSLCNSRFMAPKNKTKLQLLRCLAI